MKSGALMWMRKYGTCWKHLPGVPEGVPSLLFAKVHGGWMDGWIDMDRPFRHGEIRLWS